MSQIIPKQLINNKKIKCAPIGSYIGNRKCHNNSLSYALNNTSVTAIVAVAQVFSDNTCVAHFIVKLKNGAYIDPTYGNLTGELDEYLIEIKEYSIENFDPIKELIYLKNYLFNLQPWYIRLFTKNKY